mmetsp:Transcript_14270/g.29603  ORF Transcript_14270/g.29603 Transcript_14270/m.29603 type:complete len:111 (-) Transcript_14270:9-341(-)
MAVHSFDLDTILERTFRLFVTAPAADEDEDRCLLGGARGVTNVAKRKTLVWKATVNAKMWNSNNEFPRNDGDLSATMFSENNTTFQVPFRCFCRFGAMMIVSDDSASKAD